jgi:hypothetical protein
VWALGFLLVEALVTLLEMETGSGMALELEMVLEWALEWE